MERKRKAGRFVREDGVNDVTVEKKTLVGAPRPKYCRTYARKRVAEALPEIVDAFRDCEDELKLVFRELVAA